MKNRLFTSLTKEEQDKILNRIKMKPVNFIFSNFWLTAALLQYNVPVWRFLIFRAIKEVFFVKRHLIKVRKA